MIVFKIRMNVIKYFSIAEVTKGVLFMSINDCSGEIGMPECIHTVSIVLVLVLMYTHWLKIQVFNAVVRVCSSPHI